MQSPVVLECVCTNRAFLLSPPHRKRVVMSCPAALMASMMCLVPSFTQQRYIHINTGRHACFLKGYVCVCVCVLQQWPEE